MLFLGLYGDIDGARLECALIAARGEDQYEVLANRVTALPEQAAGDLAGMAEGFEPELVELTMLHTDLGDWVGIQALATLEAAGTSPQAVELAGFQGFAVEELLPLGDLARVTERSRLIVTAITGQSSAEECAVAAWQLWHETRQKPPSSGQTSLTEGRNPLTLEIDRLPTLEALRLINREDARIVPAVGSQLPAIAEAVDQIAARMQRGGRMIYAGAGTSGRMGVLDASEIPPTYGTDPGLVVAVIAGGDISIKHSLEGVEDDREAGAQAVADLNAGPNDTVIGIAASGATPYVLAALEEGRRRGALTVSIACNSPAPVEAHADIVIAPLVGPEVITGSTRMKAGTAQKLTLNLLSTMVMVRLGKTYSNLMVDVQTTNTKLRRRARHIVAQACEIDDQAAGMILSAAGNEVKTAIVAHKAGIAVEEARRRLAASGGRVRAALEMPQETARP